MKSKTLKLTILYYCFIVLCGCCSKHYTYVAFSEIDIELSGYGEFRVYAKDPVQTDSKDAQENRILASLSNFKSASATQACERYIYFEKSIIDYNISSNLSFRDSINAGESLNNIFRAHLAGEGASNEIYELGSFYPLINDTAMILRDVYFELEMSDGSMLLDTVFDAQL